MGAASVGQEDEGPWLCSRLEAGGHQMAEKVLEKG